MSSQEMKKKDKGKEIVSFEFEEDSCFQLKDVSMHSSDQQDITDLQEPNKVTYKQDSDQDHEIEKIGLDQEEDKSSSSKITPCIFYTSDQKARLRWSSDLHDCFLNAVAKLGGPDQTTPKTVKEMMGVEGISLYHVKSHLQKFRLGKCNIRDGRNQYFRLSKGFRTVREIRKTCVPLDSPRGSQENIKPKVIRDAKQKRKKEKEVRGSLYKLIQHELHLRKSREEQRMQMDFAIENNQCNMLETQYFKTNDSQQLSIIIPQSTTYVEEFCNNDIACVSLNDSTQNTSNTSSMYESTIHRTQVNLEFCDNQNNNMAQGFIDPHISIESQSMFGSSTITTQQQLPLNDDSIYDQVTLESTIPVSTATESIPTYVPYNTYSSYSQYSTLQVVKAQLDSLQNSNTSRTQESVNLSSSVTINEVDLVDKYIDWAKVEEFNFEFDPVQVLEALGFGVNP